MKRNVSISICAALLGLGLTSCVEENADPAGLRPAKSMGGAQIVFDLDARPLPDVPFPNDVATRIDPSSPTGKRVNISTLAATDLEAGVREKANQLDGFSTYGSIWVKFTDALDVQNIINRHRSPVPDFSDDAVFLVNVDKDSEEYGRMHLLDLGSGNFPVTMKDPGKYFNFDPRREGTNLAYESVQEVDLNGNGKLDPIEDTDDDGRWDSPNTVHVGADPLDPHQMLDFYERESNTLIIRTLEVLEPATTYAVVLTSMLVDENGVAVDSPFEFINHARQTKDLEPLREILPKELPERFDAKLEGVRFAWTFTTQTTTLELEALREGLYGSGNFSYLAREYPADLKLIHKFRSPEFTEGETFAPIGDLVNVLIQVFAADLPIEGVNALTQAASGIEYIVGGSFVTPYFLADKDGLAGPIEETALNINTHDEDEVFEIDLNTGEAEVGQDEVTWWCTVPKSQPGREPPYPVVIYGHGYGGARLEAVGFAGQMAKFGLVTCAIDNVAHGLPVNRLIGDVPIDPAPLLDNIGLGNMIKVLDHGRHRDLTNDGLDDPGGDYWVADVFHTRDNVRQTTIDYMQFIRIMRSWNGQKTWPEQLDEGDPYIKPRLDFVAGWDANNDGEPELAGDFNGDGVVDFGGDQPYYAWGQSLGGIQSAVLVAVDPAVRAAAPTAGGAGLGDIGIRSTQGGVPEAVVLPIIGPIVLGRPLEQYNAETDSFEWSGSTQLEWLVPDQFDEVYLPFATVDGLETGDQVVIRNLKREERTALIEEGTEHEVATVRGGIFRKGLAADAIGGNERRAELGFDPTIDARELTARTAPVEDGLTQRWYLRRGASQFVSQEIASTVDFEWAEGEAPDGLKPNEHSIVFDAVLEAAEERLYTIEVEVQGRAQLYVDGRRVINITNDTAEWRRTLVPGEPHKVQLYYDRHAAAGLLKLSWSADSLEKQIIPASAWKTHIALSDDEEAELAKHVIENARDWGDPFVIEIYDADGNLKHEIDTFEQDVYFQNIKYPAGSPLAALREGYGLERQTPEFRRFLAIAQMILDKADPASYARHYFEKPLQFPYEKEGYRDGASNVLVIPTTGDSAVPVNTGISIARIAGILEDRVEDQRYGMTTNQYLADNWAYEGISWLDRFPAYPDALFDVDDLDNGTFTSPRYPDRLDDPNPDAAPPVRAMIETPRGISALRIPYTQVVGEHGFDLPDPTRAFDIHTFMANQIGYYFANGGEVLSDDPCMEEMLMENCSFFNMADWDRPRVE